MKKEYLIQELKNDAEYVNKYHFEEIIKAINNFEENDINIFQLLQIIMQRGYDEGWNDACRR